MTTLLFAGLSCRKPIPSGEVSDPELQFSGTFDGLNQLWMAGVNDCIQDTDYAIDSLGLKMLTAEFENCAAGAQLRIEFYPIQANSSLDNSLKEGRRLISPNPLTTYYNVSFNNESFSKSNVGYHWDFGNGEESTEDEPVQRFPADTGEYNICLKATSNQVTSEICQIYKPGQPCRTDFYWSLNPYKWKFYGEYTGGTQVQWDWTFSTGISSQSATVDYPYPSSVVEDKVCLTAQSISGCRQTGCQNVIVDSSQIDVVANYSYSESLIQEPDPTVLYKTVRIIYTNSSGTTYYSDGDDNATASFLSISNVESYKTTASGLQARKITFNTEAVLKSRSGDRILLKKGEGTMAFRLED